MHLNARIYKTFCCSVLSFLCQWEDPPAEVLKADAWALRRLAPGSGNWIMPTDLQHFKHNYGLPFDFPGFCNMALSAKMRVSEYEPQIPWQQYSQELARARSSACFTHAAWSKWYQNSHVVVVL